MDNILTDKDITNIKESLTRSIIQCNKNANEKEFPTIVRMAMTQAAISYRETLEKIEQEIIKPQQPKRLRAIGTRIHEDDPR